LTVDGRPLLSLSFALNQRLFGPEPWGYHLVNLLIHIGAGVLLFGVVRRTLELPRFRERYASSGTWLALAMAAIWLVHPLQTESVTYIVQRAESLMGMLFLLTMYCSIRGFTGEKSGRWYLAAVTACACGMGVKQTMFSAPLLVLLYDGLFISDSFRAALMKRWRLYAGLFTTWLIIFGIIGLTWQESTIDFIKISPLRYALTQPLVILYYLRLAFWPAPLVLEYGWALEDQWWRIVLPGVAILGMLGVMFHGIRRRRWYGFVAAWFFLILAPTSSLAPMRQALFEHRMYLSLAAVVVLAVIGCEVAVRKLASLPVHRVALGGCMAIAVVAVLAALTHDRNRDYHTELGMWQDAVVHRPANPLAHTFLGNALQALGRPGDAIPHYRKALQLDPGYAEGHNNWGMALDAVGRPREALSHYQQAVQLKPGLADAQYNLGNALQSVGRTAEALAHYRQALQRQPNHVDARYNLGNALLIAGRAPEAIGHYRQAVRLKPDFAEAHNNLGHALQASGHPREALKHCAEAVRIKPGMAEAHFNLGNALVALGRLRDATEAYRKAVHLNPYHADAHNNLGAMFRESGRYAAAIKHFEQALRLNPAHAPARKNLRETRAMMGEDR
jgi:protein O-mannosyl-transferase